MKLVEVENVWWAKEDTDRQCFHFRKLYRIASFITAEGYLSFEYKIATRQNSGKARLRDQFYFPMWIMDREQRKMEDLHVKNTNAPN